MASILIVEDEMITALAMKQLVESWGHIVPAIVSNGAGAIRLARELDPDLILMDIFLANGVTGIDAARALEDRTRASNRLCHRLRRSEDTQRDRYLCFNRGRTKTLHNFGSPQRNYDGPHPVGLPLRG